MTQGSLALASHPMPQDSDLEALRRRVQELELRVGDSLGTPRPAATQAEDEMSVAGGEDDATGTDPRAFGSKFMPYYRYTELKNDVTINDLVLFGLFRFSQNVAMTYEFPIMKEIDYGGLREFQAGSGIPPSDGGGLPTGGAAPGGLESDGDSIGIGDLNLRFMFKNDRLRRDSTFGQMEVMGIMETTVPTANQDILGGETWVISPGFALIMDMPANGFFASMNFYDFDMVKDRSRGSTERYRGRWFYMQPLTPPSWMAEDDPKIPDFGVFGGLYLLPELQPVYDFETDEFSVWIAPEVGKMLAPGRIIYAKPGWGIDQERPDRQFTFEVGFRWFF